jgi:hypothetical protein
LWRRRPCRLCCCGCCGFARWRRLVLAAAACCGGVGHFFCCCCGGGGLLGWFVGAAAVMTVVVVVAADCWGGEFLQYQYSTLGKVNIHTSSLLPKWRSASCPLQRAQHQHVSVLYKWTLVRSLSSRNTIVTTTPTIDASARLSFRPAALPRIFNGFRHLSLDVTGEPGGRIEFRLSFGTNAGLLGAEKGRCVQGGPWRNIHRLVPFHCHGQNSASHDCLVGPSTGA